MAMNSPLYQGRYHRASLPAMSEHREFDVASASGTSDVSSSIQAIKPIALFSHVVRPAPGPPWALLGKALWTNWAPGPGCLGPKAIS